MNNNNTNDDGNELYNEKTRNPNLLNFIKYN